MEIIHYHFKCLDSTNDWAKQRIKSFDRDKITLVTANCQKKGRGQYGRTWFSPDGINIYGSFCFFTKTDAFPTLSFTHLLANTIAGILRAYGVNSHLKWPNDLIVNQKKIAGILCETTPFSTISGVVLGLGLNINMSESDLKQIDQPATSLYMETNKKWDFTQVLSDLKKHFSIQLAQFLKMQFIHVRDHN
ncbi:MAG: biotin--[acetyl-CoA-carboxylase] ligase [Chlamydiales bacterium]